eukprot:gene15828-20220_t
MDGLDIYIGDYTQPDPLPEGMLRKMASAHAMGFFDHEKKADAAPDVPVNGAAVEASADAEAIAPALAQPRDDAEGHAPADVAQSGVCNAIPSAPSSELEMAARPHKDANMTTTLICPFMYLAHYDLVTTPAGLAELSASRLDPDLLRLCIGCEPVEEIIAALAEALSPAVKFS